MSKKSNNLDEVNNSLAALGSAIANLSKAPAGLPDIPDRTISGNKIYGGKIAGFASVGIQDAATKSILVVDDNGITVNAIHAKVIKNDIKIEGELQAHSIKVAGEIHAQKLHVDELSADIRHERSSPLEFRDGKSTAYGKGLIWPGGKYTKQFVLNSNPDRLFSSESLELHADQEYMINGNSVLSETALGNSVTTSNLKRVGRLNELSVNGNVNIDNFVIWDSTSNRLSIGTEAPNGMLSIGSMDHEFIVDPTDSKSFNFGTYTTSTLNIVTDNTPRITLHSTGGVVMHDQVSFKDPIGVGVVNFQKDTDITTAGPVRFQNKKFEVGPGAPKSGNYAEGDIVWNDRPKPTGYVGWICVRNGSPGEWKPFGQIAK